MRTYLKHSILRPSCLCMTGLMLVLALFLEHQGLAQKTTASDILAAGATLKQVFEGEDIVEGPAMSPEGVLYFSEFPLSNGKPGKAGIIWRLNPLTGESSVFRSPSGMSNGLAFDANGDLIACEGADFGGRRLTRTDMRTGKSVIIAGLYRGRPFNSPNDVTVDEQGRVYFTDPRYNGLEPMEQNLMGVYRVDRDGSVHLVAANVTKPNGIAISPDQKTLYVANNDFPGNGNQWLLPDDAPAVRPTPGNGSLMAYDLLPDGSLKFRGRLIDFGATGPDGMAIDKEGNLYIAHWDAVEVFTPKGERLTEIKSPQTRNLCFGRGRFSKTLFIAAGTGVYMLETKKEGYNIPLHGQDKR